MASEPADNADNVVEAWTDGGCKPNPGPGGWGAVLRYRGHQRELSGADPATTNNRMELTAATAALEALKRPCRVRLHTDSEYVRNGVTRWHQGWVRRNWRNAAGDPVANMDLWQRLLDAAAPHEIDWRWVRGHAGDPMNERADVLATTARQSLGRRTNKPPPLAGGWSREADRWGRGPSNEGITSPSPTQPSKGRAR